MIKMTKLILQRLQVTKTVHNYITAAVRLAPYFAVRLAIEVIIIIIVIIDVVPFRCVTQSVMTLFSPSVRRANSDWRSSARHGCRLAGLSTKKTTRGRRRSRICCQHVCVEVVRMSPSSIEVCPPSSGRRLVGRVTEFRQ